MNSALEDLQRPDDAAKAEAADLPPLLPTASPPQRQAPRPLLAIALYFLAIFIGAAIVAPRFYASALFLAENGGPFWVKLAQQPFHRYVGRSLLLLGLVGLPVFLKALRIPSARSLGLSFRARNWGEGIQGAVWGFAALSITAALAVSFGARSWNLDHTSAEIIRHVRNTAFVALLVGTIEELLFRGALFRSLRRGYPFWTAAIISSGIYALLHFLERPESPRSVEWYSGFVTLGQMLRGFLHWKMLIPAFFNLAIIGAILALALERTDSLLFSIGLHASLIFCVKSFGFFSKSITDGNSWAWGSNKLIDGWATGLVLILGFFALRALLPNAKREGDD